MIDPQDMAGRFPLEHFLETAERYFQAVSDPTPLMSKPFTYLNETPDMLLNMGLLLSGLRLGKTMTVLDFGAGTCWLSRFLAQLHCQTISCDVSKTALDIGKRLFAEYPLIGGALYEPVFLLFDGRRIELADETVDRIVCFDAFHHVPNIDEVLAELARVLKTGGIAGFSEPGPHHSRTPSSQYEMANHRVLENDIRLGEIFASARKGGFTDLSCKMLCDRDLSLRDYEAILSPGEKEPLKTEIWRNVAGTMTNKTTFFLYKGNYLPDSRSHVGLAHELEIDKKTYTVGRGEKLKLTFRLANTGTAVWLATNSQIFGIVRLASHIYDGTGNLISVDHSRHDLTRMVKPGESLRMSVEVPLPGPGSFRLAFDLVAEGVTWFENVGAKPVLIEVEVK